MFELRTLGRLDLRGDDGRRIESVLLHSKRLSLLTYLCACQPADLHRRDTLVALFWPELDDAHARGALRQELYELRRSLGEGALVVGRSEAIGVDPQRLWCDVRAFEEALAAGRLADALELWRGEFAPGLHVNGGEFERWLDEERDRLGRMAVEAARRLVAEAVSAGDLARAVACAHRITELAPYDETGWQSLIGLLDRSGDRAGALAAYNTLAAHRIQARVPGLVVDRQDGDDGGRAERFVSLPDTLDKRARLGRRLDLEVSPQPGRQRIVGGESAGPVAGAVQ